MDLVEIQRIQELQEISELLGEVWDYMGDRIDFAEDTGINKEGALHNRLGEAIDILERMIG